MKPILFNTEMVRAILDGRKTVTRRLVKPAPRKKSCTSMFNPATQQLVFYERLGVGVWKAPYKIGDILYVRETWAFDTGDDGDEIGTGTFAYRADDIHHPDCKWRPSIHMPKEAARVLLRVMNVRTERLQDMRLIDCLKEGVQLTTAEQSDFVIQGVRARERFSGVWDSTIKPAELDDYGWDANPWVWVIEFERISKQEAMK